jgi:uncharacterized membrane protein
VDHLLSDGRLSVHVGAEVCLGSKNTGAVIALLGALVWQTSTYSNESPVYDAVWGYVVPVAIPMLLFKADLRKNMERKRKNVQSILVCGSRYCIGAIVATFALHSAIPQLGQIAGMMTASYIGGGVNFVAITAFSNLLKILLMRL